jgi:hypothetical protein
MSDRVKGTCPQAMFQLVHTMRAKAIMVHQRGSNILKSEPQLWWGLWWKAGCKMEWMECFGIFVGRLDSLENACMKWR